MNVRAIRAVFMATVVVTLGLCLATAVQATIPVPVFMNSWGMFGTGNGQFNGAPGVAVGDAGNVYTVDAGNNRIQKFNASGGFMTSWGTFGAGNGQFNTPYGIDTDASGDVYVADSGNNRIQKFDSTGAFIAKWEGAAPGGTAEGEFNNPSAVNVDAFGNVWVSDTGNNRVQEFTQGGAFIKAIGWGVQNGSNAFQICTTGCQTGLSGPGIGQFNTPIGIATDASGNVFVADAMNNRVQKFDPSGNFLIGWGTTGTLDGQFANPVGVSVDLAGTVYVADAGNNRIQKFDAAGNFLTKWGTFGASPGQFSDPRGVATDATGSVYVADYANDRIQEFDVTPTPPDTVITFGPVGTVASTKAPFQFSSDWPASYGPTFKSNWGTPGGADGQFNNPGGVAIDASGDVFVADNDNPRIQKFDAAGNFLTKWGSLGSGNGQFINPAGVATDASGNVYVADSGNNRIQKFDASGNFLTEWGSIGAAAGQFANPVGVATDAAGNVYVADSGNHRIQKFDGSGAFMTAWGTSGAANGQFANPTGVATDNSGKIYVADRGNHRIQKFDFSGTFLAAWGTNGSGDGQFNNPVGVGTDASGHVYVADFDNHRVQKFDAFGAFLTKWGTVGNGNGQFVNPVGVAADAAGNVYVADKGNNRIQKFDATLSFECSLDAGPFVACPKVFTGLSQGSHSLFARAVNVFGEGDPTPASQFWMVDSVAPDTTIDFGPSGTVSSNSPSFMFSSTEPGSTFECNLDAGGYSPCSSPKGYVGLSEGPHTFDVRATDPASNTDPTQATQGWTIDTTIPDTSIDSGPSGTVSDPSPSFTFSSGEPGVTFECSLDASPFTACSSPEGYVGLADGPHTFQVRAVDAALNTDPTPASTSWTIDATIPDTTIDAGPTGTVSSTSATFFFSSGEPGAAFECELDAGGFGPCTSPRTYPGLVDGPHNFLVRATDAALNTDPTPASRDWTIDSTIPDTTIDAGPTGTVGTPDATFDFSSNEAGATFECRLDALPFVPCASPEGYTGLTDGPHVFEVRAGDAAGNLDPTPAGQAWTIDTTTPDTTIDSGPSGTVTDDSPVFLFSSIDVGATFECQLDGDPFAPCTSPQGYPGLSDGSHTFHVRATDAAGNTDPTGAGRDWTIDTTDPETTILSGPATTVSAPTVLFTFDADELGATFECSLDASPFVPCASPHPVTGLADGPHTFDVRATDPVGNVDASPASWAWTVDTSSPDTAPPDTFIFSGPSGTVDSASALFTFGSDEPGSTFECALDAAAFAACTSPESLTGLSAGAHTFRVRATDAAANEDPTPAFEIWTVDLSPPDTYQPDLQVKLDADLSYLGDDVYNLDGAGQSVEGKGAPPSTAVFDVKVQNDGTDTDTIIVEGTDVASRFTVAYLHSGTDITQKVLDGDYEVSLDAAADVELQVKIKSEEIGTGYLGTAFITATSSEDDTKQDVVVASNIAKTAAGGLAPVRLAGSPGNDDFSSATVLTGTSVTQGPDSTVGATRQAGEPNHRGNSGGSSIWYSWTAPAAGTLVIDTSGSDFDTTMGAYTGPSVGALTALADGDDVFGSLQSQLTLEVSAFQTISISVDGFVGQSGDVQLQLDLVPPPANDSFSAATVIAGSDVSEGAETNDAATKQPSEPDHGGNVGGASVWYSWTAPSNGTTQISVAGSSLCDVLGVYQGASVATLVPVAADDACGGSEVTFPATSGNTYAIAVDGEEGDSGSFDLDLFLTAAPANDDLASSTALSGVDITSGPASNLAATKQVGEPNHGATDGGASVWYSWTAPEVGTAVIDTAGSDFDTDLGVYTGALVSALTPVASNDDYASVLQSRVVFPVVSGQTYRIAVDGYDGDTGEATLHVQFGQGVNTTIDSSPPAVSGSTTANFTFSAVDPDSVGVDHFECQLDSEGWTACTSPFSYTGLASGPHTVQVRVTDSVGVTDPSPASRSWTIDTVPPGTTIDTGPAGTVATWIATLAFSSDDGGATFECKLDGGAFSACVTPKTYNVSVGAHTVSVRAVDVAGNVDATPATRTWTASYAKSITALSIAAPGSVPIGTTANVTGTLSSVNGACTSAQTVLLKQGKKIKATQVTSATGTYNFSYVVNAKSVLHTTFLRTASCRGSSSINKTIFAV